MSTSTVPAATRKRTDHAWLRLVQVSLAVIVVPLGILAITGTFMDTISGGNFRFAADYWYTSVGLPITLAGIGITLGVHKLQHGADGRLGTIGVWINTLALIELFAQLSASIVQSAEVRWGPAYPVFSVLSFAGVALVAAGSWRTGLLPKWMLGIWPLIWIIGSLAAQSLTPLLLIAFLVIFGVALTRRVHARAGAPAARRTM